MNKLARQILKEHFAKIGAKGGKKTSQAKTEANKVSLAKARAARWTTKSGRKSKKG